MEKPTDQDYLILKSQTDDLEDLIGRLLFRILGVSKRQSAFFDIVEGHDGKRHAESVKYARENIMHQKVIGRLMSEVKKAIDAKEVDLSSVVAGLKTIDKSVGASQNGAVKLLDALVKASPRIENSLKEVRQAILDSRVPETSMDGIIASQDKGFEALGKLVVSLTEELKKQKISTVKLEAPVEVAEPKWWKPFVLSWEPLEKLLEKLSKRTFKVEQAGAFEVTFKGLPKEISKALGEELTRIMPRIMPHAGYNNPFSFDDAGNLKVSGGSSGGGDASEATLQLILDAVNGLETNTTGLATEATLQSVASAPVVASATSISSSGDNTIVAITNTPRLYYISLSANGANSSDVTATVKIGSSQKYIVSLKAGSIWARNIGAGRNYITGSPGDDIVVTLSAAQTVHVSVEYSDN
jgi:hypothetical protein